SGVIVDFSQLGAGSSVSPDSCEQETETFNCNFTVNNPLVSGAIETINLIKLTDKVGNEGPHVSTDLIVDTASPHVNRLEFLGLSGEREKEYYESGDKLLFRMNITETKGGLFFKVDLNDVVMGSESAYPATDFSEEGWQVFTEESCQEDGDYWICEFLTTGELKSGHQSAAHIEVILEDTAGNKIVFSEDEWNDVLKKGSAESRGDGKFVFEKPVAVNLRADDRQAQILEVRLVGCENDLGALGRDVLWNNLFVNPASSPVTVNLILEFPPFDAKEYFGAQLTTDGFTKAYMKASCAVEIYTAKDGKALSFAEEEVFEIQVPFGFTSLGSQEAALEATIAKEKEALQTGFWGFMDTLNTIIKVVRYIALAAQLIADVIGAFNLAESIVDAQAGVLELIPVPPTIKEVGLAERVSFCMGNQAATGSLATAMEVLQFPLQILSCKKTLCDLTEYGDDWYVLYSCSIVNWYNTFAGSINTGVLNLAGEPSKAGDNFGKGFSLIVPTKENYEAAAKQELVPSATSVEDNLYLSIASLCIPGVIKNVEKYRQIKCRKLYCLMNEVPQGVATIESCNKLEDVLTCKYFYGPLFQLIPLVNLWDNLLGALQALLTDPVAWVTTAVYFTCTTICLFPIGTGTAVAELHPACGVSYVLLKILKIINDAYEGGKQLAQEFSDQGADFCSMVLTDEEETPAEELSAEEVAAAQAQGNVDNSAQVAEASN
ncbi:hypothetical protein HYT52_01650, partial [Candidatus Woesearchaeota archaeon]|nr:hypothetical protein [Candidatus Woesearchaeota archaeon]